MILVELKMLEDWVKINPSLINSVSNLEICCSFIRDNVKKVLKLNVFLNN